MNISYKWLKDLVETDLSPQDLGQRLTDAGLAVEGIHAHGEDFVFDIDLTSNRGDALSHLGVAREIAALENAKLKIQNYATKTETNGANDLVTIQDADLCHRFTARIIRNVKIAPSPQWLIKRLEAIGERSINNVADITNYVMHELGNPMHAFDLAKLAGGRIVVRRARAGETIKTLDEAERRLDETMLAICDAEKPAAVAGIMGGLDSSITDETTDVLLEVAYFERENIRRTSRKLKLSTEASHHFERGVDIENLVRASNRATELICELGGGEAGEFVDVYPTRYVSPEIESADIQNAVKRLTGLEIDPEELSRILNALGIETKEKSQIPNPKSQIFLVPTWRHDLAIETDLVEEIARIYGFDKIREELPPAYGAGEYQASEPRKKHLRQALADLGFNEAISYSFIDAAHDETFELVRNLVDDAAEEKFVTLQDSIIEGAVRMRPTLLSGLLDAVRTNFNRQRRDLKLFEIGRVFAADARSEDKLPAERELLSLVLTGGETLANRAIAARQLDFYDAKGALEAAADALHLPALEFAAADVKHLRRGQAAEIKANGAAVGTIGRLADDITARYKFRQPVFVAEVDLQTLLQTPTENIAYRPLPVYPGVVRDVSLLVKRTTGFAAIRRTVEEQGVKLCRRAEFVDLYEGAGVADDERSITIRLEYRSDERTLVEKEVDDVHERILEALAANLNARTRV